MRSLSGIYRERKRMFTGYSLFVHEINIGIMKWNAKLASGTVHFYSCRTMSAPIGGFLFDNLISISSMPGNS